MTTHWCICSCAIGSMRWGTRCCALWCLVAFMSPCLRASGQPVDAHTVKAISTAISSLKGWPNTSLAVDTQSKTLSGTFFGHDLSGVELRQYGAASVKPEGLAGETFGGLAGIDSIVFDKDALLQNKVHALLYTLHELIHCAFLKT